MTGADVQIAVRRGCLHVRGDNEHRIEKLPRTYERIVIDGACGLVTLEAMAWMRDHGIAWSVLWRDRGVIGASIDGEGDPGLWRAQATAEPGRIMRVLLAGKLAGQASNAEMLGSPDTAKRILGYAESLALSDEPTRIMGYEGHAAKAYWRAWETVEVPFLADHMLEIPPRWIRFAGRKSLAMEGSNRRASDPVNALINYAYKVGETLCVRACYAVGLSPVLGLSHSRAHVRARDGESPRPSMALDLLEVIRPACDRVVLGLLDYGQGIRPYLRWHDFLELDTGVVRVESDVLRERIIGECSRFQGDVMECASEVRRILREQC